MWRSIARSRAEWQHPSPRTELAQVAAWIDTALAASPTPRVLDAWCCACGSVRSMRISWEHATISPDGVVVPDWSTTPTCQGCGLRSACRALVQFVADHGGGDGSVVLAGGDERPENPTMRRALGAVADVVDPVQSHADWIVAHGVLERSSDPRRLVADWCAALRPGGRLALATTFDPGLDVTESLPDVNGGPRHRFGWDLLEVLSTAGFGDVAAHHAWGPWQGHLGWSNFVIGASA